MHLRDIVFTCSRDQCVYAPPRRIPLYTRRVHRQSNKATQLLFRPVYPAAAIGAGSFAGLERGDVLDFGFGWVVVVENAQLARLLLAPSVGHAGKGGGGSGGGGSGGGGDSGVAISSTCWDERGGVNITRVIACSLGRRCGFEMTLQQCREGLLLLRVISIGG